MIKSVCHAGYDVERPPEPDQHRTGLHHALHGGLVRRVDIDHQSSPSPPVHCRWHRYRQMPYVQVQKSPASSDAGRSFPTSSSWRGLPSAARCLPLAVASRRERLQPACACRFSANDSRPTLMRRERPLQHFERDRVEGRRGTLGARALARSLLPVAWLPRCVYRRTRLLRPVAGAALSMSCGSSSVPVSTTSTSRSPARVRCHPDGTLDGRGQLSRGIGVRAVTQERRPAG